jgi:uncharacterized protein (TIGR02594 family)
LDRNATVGDLAAKHGTGYAPDASGGGGGGSGGSPGPTAQPEGPAGRTPQDGELGPQQALAIARQHLGEHEIRDQGKLSQFFASKGLKVNPATVPWCATFVSSSLKAAGIKTAANPMGATSYGGWGEGVKTSEAQPGDVAVTMRGLRVGQKGGHVGIVEAVDPKTGKIKVISGNSGDRVKSEWENPRGLTIRRATPDMMTADARRRPGNGFSGLNAGAPGLGNGIGPTAGPGFGGEQRGELDRGALDRANAMRVTGTGKLSVDVKAPRGTKVEAQGEGLFKKTEVDRQTQMEPAQSSPKRGGGGDDATMSI